MNPEWNCTQRAGGRFRIWHYLPEITSHRPQDLQVTPTRCLEHLEDGAVCVRIDFGWNSRAVGRDPVLAARMRFPGESLPGPRRAGLA